MRRVRRRTAPPLGGSTRSIADPDTRIEDVAPLHEAEAAHVSFLDNRKYVADFRSTRAGACLVHPEFADQSVAPMSRLTRPINYLDQCALSVPCCFTRAGLPISLQIVGRGYDEARVLRIGWAYENATPWHERHAAVHARDPTWPCQISMIKEIRRRRTGRCSGS